MNKKLIVAPLFGALALSVGLLGNANAVMGKGLPKKPPIACAFISDSTLAQVFQCPPLPQPILVPVLPVIPPPPLGYTPPPGSKNYWK